MRRTGWGTTALAVALVLSCAAPATAGDYRFSGEIVRGAPTIAEAPQIVPGQIQDTFPVPGDDGSSRFFRISVPEGVRLHASVTAVPSAPEARGDLTPSLSLQISIVDAKGDACQVVEASNIGDEYSATRPILATASTDALGSEESCAAGDLFIHAQRGGTMLADTGLRFELRTAIEPGDDGEAFPAPPTVPLSDEGPSPLSPEGPEFARPGHSFTEATPLASGSHRLRLSPDRPRYVSIPVSAGQRLRWRAEVTSAEHGDGARTLVVGAWNPMRMPVPLATDSDDSTAATPGSVLGAGYAAPVSPRNRESEDLGVAGVWMPGRQVLSLTQLAPLEVDESTEEVIAPSGDIDVILTLEVEGEPWQQPTPPGAADRIAGAPWGRIAAGSAALAMIGIALVLGGLGLVRRR